MQDILYIAYQVLGNLLWEEEVEKSISQMIGGVIDLRKVLEDRKTLTPLTQSLINILDEITILDKDGVMSFRKDRNRVLLGTPKPIAPPWESVWRTKEYLVQQQPAMEVLDCYLKEGFGFDGILDKPPDHIGLELLFTATLMAEGRDEQAKAFFRSHPRVFMKDFGLRVADNAKTPLLALIGETIVSLSSIEW